MDKIMWETVQEMLKNGIIQNVILSLIAGCFNWLKSRCGLKKKNKDLGYWAIKYKELPSFNGIAMEVYIMLAIILFCSMVIDRSVALWGKNNFSIVIAILFYVFAGAVCIILTIGNKKTKIECLTNGKEKKLLLFLLYTIFGITLCLNKYIVFQFLVSIFVIVNVSVWIYYIFKYSHRVMVLDNRYANIYIRNSEMAEFAEAGSIKQQGEWIIVNRYAQ